VDRAFAAGHYVRAADIIVYRQPDTLTIPLQASFDNKGKAGGLRPEWQGLHDAANPDRPQNEDELVVTGGLKEGE